MKRSLVILFGGFAIIAGLVFVSIQVFGDNDNTSSISDSEVDEKTSESDHIEVNSEVHDKHYRDDTTNQPSQKRCCTDGPDGKTLDGKPCASTTRYFDGFKGACGCGTGTGAGKVSSW